MNKWEQRKLDFTAKLVEVYPEVVESKQVSLKQLNHVVNEFGFPFPAWITAKNEKVSRGVFAFPNVDEYLVSPVQMAEVDRIDYENFMKELNNEVK